MKLSAEEARFLTALVREQNQTGCRGPAHQLLKEQVYPDVPTTGPGSLAFSYEANPLTSIVLRDRQDLQEIDNFLRKEKPVSEVKWPWSSPQEYKARLEEARREWTSRRGAAVLHPVNGTDEAKPVPFSTSSGVAG